MLKRPLFTGLLNAGLLIVFAAVLVGWVVKSTPAMDDGLSYDPAKIVGPERCAECHKAEVAQWQKTHHFKTYAGADDVEAMHRRDHAQEILANLDLRSAKRGVCTNCHYTMQQAEGSSRARAVAGVSCEMCHGAAKDWVETHGNYGEDASGEAATRENEPAAHREQRLAAADAAGQIRTNNLYAIVENCFQCHTVPNEELVNVGTHHAGSEDFNYLEWLNREIKHNFLYSNGETNRAAPRDMDAANRARRSFVLAEMIDVEYSLRGLAKATEEGPYAESLAKRIAEASAVLAQVRDAVPATADRMTRVLTAVEGASLAPNNEAALTDLAEQVKTEAQGFLADHDGADLGGVDAMLPENAR